jgi:type IV pilus assembly protein PilY1
MGGARLFIFLIILLMSIINQSRGIVTDYCAVPPTIGYSVSPNIMLVLQDDARMRWRAYCQDNDGDGYCDNSFDPNYLYDGYFEPDKL